MKKLLALIFSLFVGHAAAQGLTVLPLSQLVSGPATSTLNGLPIWGNTTGNALIDGASTSNFSPLQINGFYDFGGVVQVSSTNATVPTPFGDLYGFSVGVAYDNAAQITPGFTDANAAQFGMSANYGNYNFGASANPSGKTTFLVVSKSAKFRAQGQRFMDAGFMECAGIGDCAWYGSHNVTFGGYNRNGDEGYGWGLVSSLGQYGSVNNNIVVTSATRNTCNTTITHNISGGLPAQTFPVVSGTGCTAGTWVVMNHEQPTQSTNHEAVQIISSTTNSITAVVQSSYFVFQQLNFAGAPVFVAGDTLTGQTSGATGGVSIVGGTSVTVQQNNNVNFINGEVVKNQAAVPQTITTVAAPVGQTVTPAVDLITTGGTAIYGQGRILINLTQPSYTTGTVTNANNPGPGGMVGSGTVWNAPNGPLTGGTTLNPGCFSLNADNFTGGGIAFGAGSASLNDWYQIQTVTDNTHLKILSFTVANDQSYKGIGPGAGGYQIRNCAEILRVGQANPGGEAILDTNGFTWAANDVLEETIAPYPDVTGFTYEISGFSHGGTYRAFETIFNIGARSYQSGISLQTVGCTGSGAASVAIGCDATSWGTGYSVSNAGVGFAALRSQTFAISLGAGTLTDGGSPGVSDGMISWGSGLFYMRPNVANNGMDILMAAGGSGTHLLQGYNVTGRTILKWDGELQMNPAIFNQVIACNATTAGSMMAITDSSTQVWGATITGTGTPVTPYTLGFCDGVNWTVAGK